MKTKFVFLKLALVALLACAGVWKASAATTKTWTGASSADWTISGNWSPSGAPAIGDTANIPGGLATYPIITSSVTIATVNINNTGSGATVTVQTGGTFTYSSALTIGASGTLSVTGGTVSQTAGGSALTINGTLNISGGVFSAAGANIDGGHTSSTGQLIMSGGTLSTHDCNAPTAGFSTSISGGTIQCHNFKWDTSVFDPTGGTVEFNQSGAKFATGTYQFWNILVDSGDDPSFDNATTTIQIKGDFVNNDTALVAAAAASFTINGSGAQIISSASTSATVGTFGNLTINKSGGTVTLSSAVKVSGNATVTNGTFDLGANAFSRATSGGTLAVSAGGTLKIGGTSTMPANFSTHTFASTSTIEYSGSGQAVSSETYGNLTLSGSGNKSLASTVTISGSVDIRDAAHFNLTYALGSSSTVSGSVKFGGVIQSSGTWGSTSSGATYQDNIHFTVTTGTGKLNASTGSGALDHFAISTISSPQTAGTAITGITLTAQDSANNAVSSFASTVTYGGTAGIIGTSGAFALGQLTGVSVTPITAGTGKTFTVTASSKSGTATFDVNAGTADATQSTLTPTSASITANGSSTQVLTVQAKDANGNNLTSGGATVTITKQSGTGTIGSVSDVGNGTYTATVTSPTASGSGVFVATLGGSQVKSGTGSQAQSTITYTPGALDHFAISVISSPQVAGTAITGITLTAQDVNNNTVTSFSGGGNTVTYSGTAGITGTSAAFTLGVLSGVSVTPTVAGSSKTFVVTGGASKTGTSTFDVNPASASAYRITDAASGAPTAGVGDQLTITLVDQYANTVTSFGGDKTLTFSGLATADDGTFPTVTSKTGSAVALGTSEDITFTGGVSSAGGSLVAYKAQGPVTLAATDGTLSTSTTGGAGVSLTITNIAPVAAPMNRLRTPGTQLIISKSTVATNWTDANHDIVTMTNLTLTTTNGINLATNSTLIVYTNGPAVADQITYGINDGHGGTNVGYINITINTTAVFGQTSPTMTSSGGTNYLKFFGIKGYTYVVQRAPSVAGPFTDFLTTNVTVGPFTAVDPSPPNPAFYRLKWQP